MKHERITEIPEALIAKENELASTPTVSNDELAMLMDRRISYPSKRRIWTKAERLARLTIMKWSV